MIEQPNTTDTVLAVRIPEIQREKIRQAAKIEQRTESGLAMDAAGGHNLLT